jgi:hypothetical protein
MFDCLNFPIIYSLIVQLKAKETKKRLLFGFFGIQKVVVVVKANETNKRHLKLQHK